MSTERLLYAIGDIQEEFIREAAPGDAVSRRRSWPWAAALTACLALVLLIARAWPSPAYDRPAGNNAPADSSPPAENGLFADSETPPAAGVDGPGCSGDWAPSLTVDGVTYVVSSHGISAECPEGFAYAGETAVSDHDDLLPYYTNPERPEWVYVYQECYNQQTREYYMGYVRYVESVLQGLTLLRYQGEVYVYLNDTYYLPYYTEVAPEDQARYDAVPYDCVLEELPAGFEPVGKTVYDGQDLVPTSELGSNRLPEQQVLANPAEPDILLRRYYPNGLSGPAYWVFVRYQ